MRSESGVSDMFTGYEEDDPNDLLNMDLPSPSSRRSSKSGVKGSSGVAHFGGKVDFFGHGTREGICQPTSNPPPPPGVKKKPRADWSSYRNENGYFVCPFSPTRTFHNTSNLSKHCDKKHKGFRPPPRQRQDTKRRRRRSSSSTATTATTSTAATSTADSAAESVGDPVKEEMVEEKDSDVGDSTSDVDMMLPADGRSHFPLDASPGDSPFALPPAHSAGVGMNPSSAVFHSGGSINSQIFHSGSSHSSHNFGSNLAVMPPPSWKTYSGPGLQKSNSNGLQKANSNRSTGSYGFCDSNSTEKWMMELDDPEAFVDEVRAVTDSPTAHAIAPPLGDLRRGGSFHRRGRHGHGSGNSESFMMMLSGGCSRNQEGLNAGKPTNRPVFYSFKR